MLKSVDESVGRLLQTLDELKLSDNTIFIFMSDNGGNTHSNTASDKKSQGGAEKNARSKTGTSGLAIKHPPTMRRCVKGRADFTKVVVAFHSWSAGLGMFRLVRQATPLLARSTFIQPSSIYLGLHYHHSKKSTGRVCCPSQTNRDASTRYLFHLVSTFGSRGYRSAWELEAHSILPRTSREYEGHHELFDLGNDLSETTNLASKHPERVKELDALIDQFMVETKALAPKPNPNYKPALSTPTANDLMRGLVPKGCKAAISSGGLHVTREGNKAFLGTVQIKHASPVTIKLRMRSSTGRAG